MHIVYPYLPPNTSIYKKIKIKQTYKIIIEEYTCNIAWYRRDNVKKIICINIAIFIMLLSINVFANIDGLPVWSENVNQCSIPTATSSMDINAKAAILMEANTLSMFMEMTARRLAQTKM